MKLIRRQTLPIVAALRQRRYDLKMTLHELEERSGYPENTINGWETGRTVPPLSRMIDWAQALGMELVAREKRG